MLTDDAGSGRVTIAESTGRAPSPVKMSRRSCRGLDEPGTAGQTFDLISGETPIAEAVAALRR